MVDATWVGWPARSMARKLRASLAVVDADVEVTISQLRTEPAHPAAPTVVTDHYELSALADDAVRAALRVAAESLGGSGRIGICELCLRPDVVGADHAAELQATASAVFATDLYPRTPSVWWAMLEDAGFEVVHRLDGDIRLPRHRPARRLGRRVADQLGVVALAAVPSTS